VRIEVAAKKDVFGDCVFLLRPFFSVSIGQVPQIDIIL